MVEEIGNSIVRFDFYGDEIDCVRAGDTIWVSVKRVCEALGLTSHTQIEKLKGKSWSTDRMIRSVDSSGRNREHFFVDLDTVPMWLSNVN